jgi:thioredoxin family protein
MTDRLLVLGAAAAVGGLLLLVFGLYRRFLTPIPERLEVADLDLELMAGCCAFIVFTTPACRPCKAALRVVGNAARRSDGATEVHTVDAIERSDLALRYEVRMIPTVFLITASGHVVDRWKGVPDQEEVDAAVASI